MTCMLFDQIKIPKQLVDVIDKLTIGRNEKFKTNPHFMCVCMCVWGVGGGGVGGCGLEEAANQNFLENYV